MTRAIVGANVKARMDYLLSDSSNRTRSLSLKTGRAGEGGISQSTIQRIIAGEVGATLDNLEEIADALDLSLYQLLIPNLDATSPQIVPGAAKEEERLYKLWRRRSELSGKYPAFRDGASSAPPGD